MILRNAFHLLLLLLLHLPSSHSFDAEGMEEFLEYTGASGTQHGKAEDDPEFYETNSGIPHLPTLSGFMGTHGTYRFLTIHEQTALLIGEGTKNYILFAALLDQEYSFYRLFPIFPSNFVCRLPRGWAKKSANLNFVLKCLSVWEETKVRGGEILDFWPKSGRKLKWQKSEGAEIIGRRKLMGYWKFGYLLKIVLPISVSFYKEEYWINFPPINGHIFSFPGKHGVWRVQENGFVR